MKNKRPQSFVRFARVRLQEKPFFAWNTNHNIGKIRPSMKAWGEKAKAGVWPARASLHLGITLRSLNGGIPTLRFSGTSNLIQAFLMDVFLSRTGPRKNASSDAKTKYFHLACRSFSAPRRCNQTFGTAHIKMLHKTKIMKNKQ